MFLNLIRIVNELRVQTPCTMWLNHISSPKVNIFILKIISVRFLVLILYKKKKKKKI